MQDAADKRNIEGICCLHLAWSVHAGSLVSLTISLLGPKRISRIQTRSLQERERLSLKAHTFPFCLLKTEETHLDSDRRMCHWHDVSVCMVFSPHLQRGIANPQPTHGIINTRVSENVKQVRIEWPGNEAVSLH
jgi:hypothetical protein